ncbi:hypothetical protein [Enterococcus hirae]|uniref:hypothetical protein n=1 Tax=Enterococcus hirae TaxID=1354 RepID=UPI001368AA35|nr:hypothetical protein [Enterococcus hirae]NAE18214.1 hypothetical protein [Enterococcus hirae]
MIEIRMWLDVAQKVRWGVQTTHERSSVTDSKTHKSGPTQSANSEPALAITPFALAGTKGDTAMSKVVGAADTGTPRSGRGNLIAAAEQLLTIAHRLEEQAAETRVAAVAGARNLGMSWDEIAGLLGTTAPAARAAQGRAVTR